MSLRNKFNKLRHSSRRVKGQAEKIEADEFEVYKQAKKVQKSPLRSNEIVPEEKKKTKGTETEKITRESQTQDEAFSEDEHSNDKHGSCKKNLKSKPDTELQKEGMKSSEESEITPLIIEMQAESSIERRWNVLADFQEKMVALQSKAFDKWITQIKKDGAFVVNILPTFRKGFPYTHNQLWHVYHRIFINLLDLKNVSQEFSEITFLLVEGVYFKELKKIEPEEPEELEDIEELEESEESEEPEEEPEDSEGSEESEESEELEETEEPEENLKKTLFVCLSNQEKKIYHPIFVLKVMPNDSVEQDQINILKSYMEILTTTKPFKILYGVLITSYNVIFVRYDASKLKFWQSRKFPADIKREFADNRNPSPELMQMYRIIVSMLLTSVMM